MIIVGERVRPWRPMWYQRLVYSRFHELCLANPGFNRVVIQLKPIDPHDTEHMVTDRIEPELRAILSRVWILAPTVTDDDPYPLL